jgi:2-polyprenyl-3-methyl-5-hydroxy-6-metoxy-1,4-benzoquinol methylase
MPTAVSQIKKANTAVLSRHYGNCRMREPVRPCLLCHSELELSMADLKDTRFGTKDSYDIYRCTECGLEQTRPLPALPTLKKLYQSHYNFGGESGTLYTRLREQFIFSSLYNLWTLLDGDTAFHLRVGTGRMLDIGCNEGRGLRIYARNGFEVEGLELNENAAAVAKRTGFAVHTCLLSELDSESVYDVAVLSNVLEHSINPLAMLHDVRRILAPGGQVWISCPNSRSWLRVLFGRAWINWHVPFHISHFSPETLTRVLADAGYERIEIQQITPALWVAQSLIAKVLGRDNKENRHLRSPFLIPFLLLVCRFVLFPVLYFGNRVGRGDCLLAVATKV